MCVEREKRETEKLYFCYISPVDCMKTVSKCGQVMCQSLCESTLRNLFYIQPFDLHHASSGYNLQGSLDVKSG